MPDDAVAHAVEADLRRLMGRAGEAATAQAVEVRTVAEVRLDRDFPTATEVGRFAEAV